MSTFLLDDEVPIEAVRWLYFRRSGGVSTWKPFCGYDSIRLETAYRERYNGSTDPIYEKITVRGEMFEVDMESFLCIPIYWFGKKRSVHSRRKTWCSTQVVRAVWFQKINWLPLDTKLSEVIEYEHRTYAIPKLKKVTRKSHKPVHKYQSNNHEIKWMPDGTIYLVTKSAEPFGKVRLHGGLSSVPISRGFVRPAETSDRPPPITHVCFVVHGIGQQLASIRHECAKIRKTCQKVAEKLYPKLSEFGQRLEFIPVNWRSSLSLNSKTLNNVTIAQLRPLRDYINQSFVDILYYTSPVYHRDHTLKYPNGGSFLENISKPKEWKPVPQLANLFLIGSPLALFISVNDLCPPTYINPSNSNSLQSNHSSDDEQDSTSYSHSGLHSITSTTSTSKHTGIDLDETDPEALFSYFACRRVFNIFHSYDPVAYRLEPILLKHYANISPVVIPKASINHLEKYCNSQTATLKGSNSSLAAIDEIESTHSVHTLDLSDSDSDSSDLSLNGGSGINGSDNKEQKRKFFKRLSVVDENSVYKQHQSLAMKIFSNYITRRSSNVTNLNPILCEMRSMPTSNEKQLKRRIDYEWQKSFSPLAILGAHNSYWSSHEPNKPKKIIKAKKIKEIVHHEPEVPVIKKGKPSKVAPLPEIAKKTVAKKKVVKNPLIQRRPKNFGIGQDIQPKRNLYRFAKWPKYIELQRKKAILKKRLKIPPPIHQFSQTLDRNSGISFF
ncbi:putative 60s ribosomal protein L7a [Schistosoma mansoni]|uniref:putative 60s ribosomal protein L7a n=1 Tax=Schistosoma mansoni TaxID=6183 RepID=UPI00022DC4AC|nr:putative 60s ribosomal protein L7a [Schistosoma mansoni]|eukprot:XP_018650630.1 putative 60s ribosomal protein L7a [Schistosoma mansoni]